MDNRTRIANRIITSLLCLTVSATLFLSVQSSIDMKQGQKDFERVQVRAIKKLSTKSNDTANQLNVLNKKVGELEAELANVKKQVDENTGDIQAHKSRLDELHNEIESVKK